MSNCESWGRYPRVDQKARDIVWRHEMVAFEEGETFLPHGLGKSYGDSCLNEGGTLLLTRCLKRFLHFDAKKGVLRCETGVTLAEILEFSVERGWFLPVTPGTKHVTLGGALANDVHGKNHHRAGTFGRHILCFELLRSDGSRIVCSLENNDELFRATIGGLGLTGVVLWVELQLKPIAGPYINMESIKFCGLDEFFQISSESDQNYEYTVAWLDCVSSGDKFARGVFMRGNHSDRHASTHKCRPGKELFSVPFDFPRWTLNHWSIKAFNWCYYNKQLSCTKQSEVHYDPFFYPLDVVGNWNRIYGRRGLLQFQCVLPKDPSHEAITEILTRIVASGRASFLAVLKEFGDFSSPGLLSFPRPGVTLCLDFPNTGPSMLKLFNELEQLVCSADGHMYPAKDACMKAESFQQFYPNWSTFAQYIDPKFSSSFWRRVTSDSNFK